MPSIAVSNGRQLLAEVVCRSLEDPRLFPDSGDACCKRVIRAQMPEVEPVFETADPTEEVVVKGLLESEGIPYVTTGAEKFDAFRGALSPMRFNPSAGIAIFLVPTPLADRVRQLLADFEHNESK